MCIRRNHYQLLLLLDIISYPHLDLPCFNRNPELIMNQLKERLYTDLPDEMVIQKIEMLINESTGHWTTDCYDYYQRYCVGIL